MNDIDFFQHKQGEILKVMPEEKSMEISVIIPVLNEEDIIGDSIKRLRKIPGLEIVVADGGSDDRTIHNAEESGADRIITTIKRRSIQMNTGAQEAAGQYVLFLHADTILPEGFENEMKEILEKPGTAAGAFSLKYDDSSPVLKFIAFTANLRSRWLKLPYGDQAIFVKKKTFQDMSGFRDLPVMEDYEFMTRARKRGRVIISKKKITASARRWKKQGFLKTWLRSKRVIIGWKLGIPPEKLSKLYRK